MKTNKIKFLIMPIFLIFLVNKLSAATLFELAKERVSLSSVQNLEELRAFIQKSSFECKAVFQSYTVWDGSNADLNPNKWNKPYIGKPRVVRIGDSEVGYSEEIVLPQPEDLQKPDVIVTSMEGKIESYPETGNPQFVSDVQYRRSGSHIYNLKMRFGIGKTESGDIALFTLGTQAIWGQGKWWPLFDKVAICKKQEQKRRASSK